MVRTRACVTAVGLLFTSSLLLVGGCGQPTPRTTNDAVIKAPTVAKEVAPKIDEMPQLHIAALGGHNTMHLFPAFGRTFIAARGYIGEILPTGIAPRPELAKGLESSSGQPVGFYGDLSTEAYAMAISYGERSESYDVYKWDGSAWKSAHDRKSHALGGNAFFNAPNGTVGTFASHTDAPFSTIDGKPIVGAPQSRFSTIASLTDGLLALEAEQYESDAKHAPRVVHWTKTGNRTSDLPFAGVSPSTLHVIQMRAKGSRAMILATIGTSDNNAESVQPYVATFDGTVWSRIECPATMGEPNVGQLSPDGTLYLRTTTHKAGTGGADVPADHLWVRPVGGTWSSIELPTSASGGKCWYQDVETDESAVWLSASCDNDEGPQQVLFTSHPAYAKGRAPEKIGAPAASQ